MDTLTSIVEEAVREYAGKGLNGYSYFMYDDSHQVMSIVGRYSIQGESFVDSSLLVRIVGDRVIIERDINDKPLVDALLQAGLKREQIVLVYAGDKVEETA